MQTAAAATTAMRMDRPLTMEPLMSHAEVTRPVPPDLNSIRLRTLATLALIPLSLGVAACDVQEPFEGEILVPLHAPVTRRSR